MARVPNLPKYGAQRSRGPSRSTAQCDVCAWQDSESSRRVSLSLPLTGHIRDLACSLVITTRAGDITAISCRPVKTARRVCLAKRPV